MVGAVTGELELVEAAEKGAGEEVVGAVMGEAEVLEAMLE